MRLNRKILSVIGLCAFALSNPAGAASTNPWALPQNMAPPGMVSQSMPPQNAPQQGFGFSMGGNFNSGNTGQATGQAAGQYVSPNPFAVQPQPKAPVAQLAPTAPAQKQWQPPRFGEYPPLITGNTSSAPGQALAPTRPNVAPAPRQRRQNNSYRNNGYRNNGYRNNGYGNNNFGFNNFNMMPFGNMPFGNMPFGQLPFGMGSSGFGGNFGFGFNGFGGQGYGGQNYGIPGLVAPFPVLPGQVPNYGLQNYRSQNYRGQNYRPQNYNYRYQPNRQTN